MSLAGWGVGAAASVGVHLGAAALLALTLQPRDVAQQPVPETALDLAAYAVDRTEARPTPPPSDPAAEQATGGASVAADDIPRSDAAAVIPDAARVAPVTAEGKRAEAEVPDAPVAAPVEEAGARLAAAAPDVGRIAAALPDASGLSAAALPEADTLAVALPPEAVAVAEAALPEPTEARPAESTAAAVPAETPVAEVATSTAPPADNLAATDATTDLVAALAAAGPRVPPAEIGGEIAATGAPVGTPVAFVEAEAAPLVPVARPAGETVATAAPSATTALPVSAPMAALTAAATPQAQPAVARVSPGEPASAIAAPAVVAAPARPDAPPAADVVPAAFAPPAADTTERAEAAASRPPPAEFATAATAWAGAEGEIDPQSLAAIQAFMQPADIAATSGNPVKDGIAGFLSSVPCSRLQAAFVPESGALELRGHIPEDGLRGPVLAALQAQVGGSIPVTDNILILPRPQCEALAAISNAGLPQSTEALTNPLIVGADAHARVFSYVRDNDFAFTMQAPDYDAYVYVDYFMADGNVLHLLPNEYLPDERRVAKSVVEIGQDPCIDYPFCIKVAPPFGQEIAAAFASSVPLFEGLRPIVEPAGPYLEELTARIAAARAEHPDFKGEWVYFFIRTSER